MSRRLLGVTAAWSLGGLHPVWDHLLSGKALLLHPNIDLDGENWQPLFLKPEQYQVLQAFSAAVVPGSTDARVSRFIDLLLSVDTSVKQSSTYMLEKKDLKCSQERVFFLPRSVAACICHSFASAPLAYSTRPRMAGGSLLW